MVVGNRSLKLEPTHKLQVWIGFVPSAGMVWSRRFISRVFYLSWWNRTNPVHALFPLTFESICWCNSLCALHGFWCFVLRRSLLGLSNLLMLVLGQGHLICNRGDKRTLVFNLNTKFPMLQYFFPFLRFQ